MTHDPFGAFLAFQQQALAAQRRNMELATRAVKAGQDAVAFWRKAHDATVAGTKAWTAGIDAWRPRR